MLFNEEQVEAAAHTNIAEYCQARGIPLVHESGDTYHHAIHDSLKITGFRWKRHSTKDEGGGIYKGNAIHFVQEYEGLSFRDAVISLLAFTKSPLLEDKIGRAHV